jgi:hypothetical protein
MFRIRIEYTIIACLAERKDISIQDLYACVNTKNTKVSLPNFYKIVGRMVDSQVLVKARGRLQIHSMYLHFIVSLADNIKKTYFSNRWYNDLENIKVWETQSFNASSLYDLDVIRMDILAQLMKKYPWEIWYYYNSHPYHMLSMTDKETANMEEIGHGLEKSYFLFGNKSFLDSYGWELYKMHGYSVNCSEKTSFPDEGYLANIIGDYIIECMLPKNLTQHYKIFFDSVSSMKDFNVQMFSHIVKMKENCSFKLIYSPEHAKKMKQKIKKHFSEDTGK